MIEEKPKKERKYGTPIPKSIIQVRYCQRCRQWKKAKDTQVVDTGEWPLGDKEAKKELTNMCNDCVYDVEEGIDWKEL